MLSTFTKEQKIALNKFRDAVENVKYAREKAQSQHLEDFAAGTGELDRVALRARRLAKDCLEMGVPEYRVKDIWIVWGR